MLLPALGHAGLTREQRAEILKSDPVWNESEEQRANADGRGNLPPTH